jgi:hypothetical protein
MYDPEKTIVRLEWGLFVQESWGRSQQLIFDIQCLDTTQSPRCDDTEHCQGDRIREKQLGWENKLEIARALYATTAKPFKNVKITCSK